MPMLCILCVFGTHGAEITVQLLRIKPLKSYLRRSNYSLSFLLWSCFPDCQQSKRLKAESEVAKEQNEPLLVWQAAPAPWLLLAGASVVWQRLSCAINSHCLRGAGQMGGCVCLCASELCTYVHTYMSM